MPATQLQTAARSLRHNTEHPAYSLDGARKVTYQGYSVRIPQNDTDFIEVIDSNRVRTAIQTNLAEVRTLAMTIDRYAYRSQYANVKSNRTWQILYNEQLRVVTYIENQTLTPKSELTIPCMTCGIVLPSRLLTIDHQRPQTGGELEAVLKTLRMLGLTREGPKGSKGQQLQQHLRHGTGIAPIPTKPNRPPVPPAQAGVVANRYSLHWGGVVFYSLMLAANAEEELTTNCLHGVMNLAPLCSSCNSRRGNPLKMP